MKVLFIGGTGIISSACSALAIERGIDLYHLNRGINKSIRSVEGVKEIIADIRDVEAVEKALGNHTFDAVVDYISFVPSQIQSNVEIFKRRAKQFVFISSASAYQTPPLRQPVTEQTPLENPFWQYSRDKIACEQYLVQQKNNGGMDYTIVRPSHTYDKTLLPFEGGYTVVDRMKRGKKIVVHGDGTSLWTLTHHKDFAVGLVGLLGNKKALNTDFHITSSEWLSWNQIYNTVADAFELTANLVHIPSVIIAKYNKEIGDSLLGDKTHSMLFSNAKLKSAVPDFAPKIPFADGVKDIVSFYNSTPQWQKVDRKIDSMFDQIIADFNL